MEASPQLVVTGGPDQGRSFALTEELVHIGRSAENQVVLTDPALGDHQASVVRRNGRYAIYTPAAGQVSVDGSDIPGERWVWLPPGAAVRLGGNTVVTLEGVAPADGTPSPAPSAPPSPLPGAAEASPKPKDPATRTPAPGRRDGGGGAKRKSRSGERKPAVAKFISDRAGEPLVKLGEDGQLPALSLSELAEEQRQERAQKKQSNPLLLYAAIGFSFVLSLGMLLIEPSGPRTTTGEKSAARETLREFYGKEGDALEPYQVFLRQALVAHSKGDYAAERNAYRRVLRLLNSADIRDPANHNGLTGRHTGRARASDADLREALESLLAR
jgi:hypothetical protein